MAATFAEERVAFPSRRGSRLVGIVHHASGAAARPAGVILCHGMESTKEGTKHRMLGDRLSRAGLTVLRFDFSYVGESEGEFADLTFRGEVEDLAGAWQYLRGRVPGPIGILGSSMGGTVALLFAAEEPGVGALVTIAAVAEPRRMLGELRPRELERWRSEGSVSLGGIVLKRAFLDDIETLDVPGACRRISCPTLVAHGDQDRVVPASDAETLFAALGGERRLAIYPGADHRFTKASDLAALLADASRWLEQHLSKEAA